MMNNKIVAIFIVLLVAISIYIFVVFDGSHTNILGPGTRASPGMHNDKGMNETEANSTVQKVFLNERKRTNYTIVVYNPNPWFNYNRISTFLETKCPYQNCRITCNVSNLIHQSAIMFVANGTPLPKDPPIVPSRRRKDQVWIVSLVEAPDRHTGKWGIYKTDQWRNTFNWTWSYTIDSDIHNPIGYVRRRNKPVNKNYTAIFQRKTKMAAWVVSHCVTKGQREIYVRQLYEHGVNVDVYGKCSGGRIAERKKREMIDKQYKFYLAFENGLCKDYVTEKFFKYFKLNVVLVVRGGADYDTFVSSDAIINTADFSSIKDIANYLKTVASNETRYTKYLRNKDKFQSFSFQKGESFCQICEKLNNLDTNRKVYTNLVEKINNGTCFRPKDIL